MNAQTAFPEALPFNAYAAYQREREHARKIEALLSRATMLLDITSSRLEMRGEDMAHIRAFIREAQA